MHDPWSRLVFQPSVFVDSFHVSHIPTSVSPPLSLIHHFSSMMSAAPDAMCWHPHINAKVNGKTKGAKWFALDCGVLAAQQSDTLGLRRKEIGSRGNESRPCDVIYYNGSEEGERWGITHYGEQWTQLSCCATWQLAAGAIKTPTGSYM